MSFSIRSKRSINRPQAIQKKAPIIPDDTSPDISPVEISFQFIYVTAFWFIALVPRPGVASMRSLVRAETDDDIICSEVITAFGNRQIQTPIGAAYPKDEVGVAPNGFNIHLYSWVVG